MRNILFIGVFRKTPEPITQLCAEEDISDFRWYKGTVREFMMFHCDLVVKGSEVGRSLAIREEVQGEGYNFHVYSRAEGVAGVIVALQNELNETKQILHKTIEQVLERGEKIDSLVQKSDTLSSQSKMFYTQAKKQNSCCSIM